MTTDIEVYTIRHAQSEKNVAPHLVSGRNTESPLTPKGIAQAERLGSILVREAILPDIVYSSTALRAIQTAEHTLRTMGLRISPVIDESVHEMSMGAWEGKPRAELYTDEVLEQIALQGKDWRVPGGESMNDVGLRMMGWLETEFGHHRPTTIPKRVLAFSHSQSIKCLASRIENWSQPKTYQTELKNAAVSLFVRKDGEWQLEYLNRYAEGVG